MKEGRVLSGMRPTGRLHLGHLFGALENWRRLQAEYHCYFFVADWHALTSDYADPSHLREYTREIVLDWLSAGIDPEKAVLFIQSRLPEHAELHLLLSMITPLPWLERNPTYKEQLQEVTNKDLSTFGFLGYPVLQAADILIYQANFVPVGVDQLPHIELTREIARRFNHLYKTVFTIPESMLTEFPKIPGTDGRKMSKSYNNCIYLSDSPETVEQKVKPMVTDPARAEVGTLKINLTPAGEQDPVFGSLPATFHAQAGHQDTVDPLPADAVLLAASDRANQAFRFAGKPIYCTQFHPELSRETLLDRLRTYPKYVEAITGLSYDVFVETRTHPSETGALLLRFVEEVMGK